VPGRLPRLVVSACTIASALGHLLWIRLSGAGAAQRDVVTAALFIALEMMNWLVTQ
jgi:hypothetical protein